MKYLACGGLLLAGLGLAGAGRPAAPLAAPPTAAELQSRLLAAIDGVQTLRCDIVALERTNGRYLPLRSSLKLTTAPVRVYIKTKDNVEALYVTGQNDNKAWVYPGAFPYVTLSLDPLGSLMRKNQHHTLLETGFGLLGGLLRGSGGAGGRVAQAGGDSTVAGRPCYVLRLRFPRYAYVPYQAGPHETTATVAARLGCGEFRILERNKLDPGTKLSPGQTIYVPTAYGTQAVVAVDQRTWLPASVAVYDERGLYEKFEFRNVVANQPIPLTEFSKDYKDYKF